MRRSAIALVLAAAFAVTLPGGLVDSTPARAGLSGLACKVLGTVGEGWWGKACNAVAGVGGKVVGAGKKSANVVGKVAGNPLVQRGAGIAAIVAWVLGGAKWTMDHMAGVVSSTTSPTLTSSWFASVYLRVEGLALFFALLFICAVAAEAVMRSDGTMLARAVFGYLPFAALLTALAAPLMMILLAVTDQLSAGLATLAGQDMTHFLTGTSAWVAVGLTAADPFFAVMAGGLVVAAGGALWVEMLIREVAVYVVVGMLPVVFAAMVWPARRVWAIRAVEVLVALVMAKVAITAVLALGGAALLHSGAGSLSRLLGGLALVMLGAFSPWLLLRLIPLAEVASATVGHIRGQVHATAGLRTPEATLASKAVEHVGGARKGTANGNGAAAAAGGVAIEEVLEQMHRRARAAESAAAPTEAAAVPVDERRPSAPAERANLAPVRGDPGGSGGAGNAPATPVSPGKTPSTSPDTEPPAAPPAVPDPQDGRLNPEEGPPT